MRNFSEAYVFAPDESGKPVLAGKMKLTDATGEFTYNEAWLDLPWAYPLDPINLPLSSKRYAVSPKQGVFGVFLDASPDDWGERIMLLRHKSTPPNAVARLLRLTGAGAGNLHFSGSRATIKPIVPLPSIDILDRLAIVIADLAKRNEVSETELKLIEHGSSMGGARPKVSVAEPGTGKSWLVKFSRESDVIDYPTVEFATMSQLANLGFDVPSIRLRRLGNETTCYLIERFDRESYGNHFISARSLFNVERVRVFASSMSDPAGYVAFARILKKVCTNASVDCAELFKRMVANILLGNTDDHARNHGLLYNVKSQEWKLSPLYDVVPIVTTTGQQALTVGVNGRESTIENALSCAKEFMLTNVQAQAIVDHLIAGIDNWEAHFISCGTSPADIALLRNVIGPK